MAVTLIISGAPVAKGRPKFARQGNFIRAYTPDKTRRYEELVSSLARKLMTNKPPFEGPIKVLATAYMPIPQMSIKKTADAIAGYILPSKKPDIDNLAKAALDACNGIIWHDDAQICSLLVKKRYALEPRLEIQVKPEETTLFGNV